MSHNIHKRKIQEMQNLLPQEMRNKISQKKMTPSEMVANGRITQEDVDEIHRIATNMHDMLIILD
jgi:hypothetical protein